MAHLAEFVVAHLAVFVVAHLAEFVVAHLAAGLNLLWPIWPRPIWPMDGCCRSPLNDHLSGVLLIKWVN